MIGGADPLRERGDDMAARLWDPGHVRFGLQQPNFTFTEREGPLWDTLRDTATTAEDAGFDSFWLMDHFFQMRGIGDPQNEMLDSWTALAAVAAVTERMRLGTLVSGVIYRNPAHLAKIGATVDVISRGRLIMGIGGGWYQQEAEAYGWDFPSRGTRLRMLDEAVQIIDRMWTEEAATFEGRHFGVRGAYCNPKPVQRPRPPIMVGGGGETMTLRTTARYADATNLFGDADTIHRKLDVLRRHCEAGGRDYGAILKTRLGTVVIDETAAGVETKLQRYGLAQVAPAMVIAGTPDRVIAQFEDLADAGVEYFMINMPDSYLLEPVKLFVREVIPAFAGRRTGGA